MITSQQMRAARALLGLDQRQIAELAGPSLPTIQRLETSKGLGRGVAATLVKTLASLATNGDEPLGENSSTTRPGRGGRARVEGDTRPERDGAGVVYAEFPTR